MKKRRLLGFLLGFVLMLYLMPMTVLAAPLTAADSGAMNTKISSSFQDRRVISAKDSVMHIEDKTGSHLLKNEKTVEAPIVAPLSDSGKPRTSLIIAGVSIIVGFIIIIIRNKRSDNNDESDRPARKDKSKNSDKKDDQNGSDNQS